MTASLLCLCTAMIWLLVAFEFQICLYFCVSFLGRKQLRDLGRQIYKVKLIITIERPRARHWPLPFPSWPHFLLLLCF